jgi:hypothetical protein
MPETSTTGPLLVGLAAVVVCVAVALCGVSHRPHGKVRGPRRSGHSSPGRRPVSRQQVYRIWATPGTGEEEWV